MFRTVFLQLKALIAAVLMIYGIVASADNCLKIVVLATADIHGNMAQLEHAVAPAVKKEFSSLPGQVIYVDIGDIAQGSFAVNMRCAQGVMRKLGEAGCTLFVPGNHELEYGFEVFKKLMMEFPGTVLAANLHAPELQKKVLPYKIVEVKGVKIAFIGLMLKDMNNCFPVAESRFQTLPGRASLRRSINQVRKEGAELIVLLRHAGRYGGGEDLLKLVKDMPEIDLVIGAHTHKPEAGVRMGNIWYVQPAAHGESILKTTIYYDRPAKRLKQIESGFLLLPKIPEILPPDADASAVPADENLDFPARRIADFTGCDLAVYAVESVRKLEHLILTPQPKLIDYYRVFPYADRIVTVKISADEFRAVIKEYAAFAYKRKQLLTCAGFTCEMSRSSLKKLAFDKVKSSYTLAISAYAAAGAGGQLPEVRRILKDKLDHKQAENACSVLQIVADPARCPVENMRKKVGTGQ